jgi:hypothetical protein
MDKKKIGIITIIDYHNFGNRLQNYALQMVIKSFGFNVITLNISFLLSKKIIKTSSLSFKSFFSLSFYINKIKNQLDKIFSLPMIFNKKRREKKFIAFSNKFIKQIDINLTNSNLDSLNSNFDFFVVGSDQIWNPIYRNGNPLDLLAFADSKKKIAYSPSFGISKIPESFIEIYSKSLSDFNKISVREFEGAKIVFELTGRKVDVLLDPTLLLNAEEWNLIKKPNIYKPRSMYILTYFLGMKDLRVNEFLNRVNSLSLYKIVNLGDLSSSKYFNADPSEFLDFISSASLILTDSYHGTIFSLIYRKPFVIFDRFDTGPKINSRFETLDALFQLKHRFINKVDYNHIFDFNFPLFDSKISLLRKKSIDFLYNSLK